MSIESDFNVFAAVFRQNRDVNIERVEFFNQRDLDDAGFHSSGAEQYATEFLMQDGEYLDEVIEEPADVSLQTVADVCGEVLQNLRDSGCYDTEDGQQPEMMQKLERLVVGLHAHGFDWEG